jgi:hypothetical protein
VGSYNKGENGNAPKCIATSFNQVKKEEVLPDVAGDRSKNVETINDYSRQHL